MELAKFYLISEDAGGRQCLFSLAHELLLTSPPRIFPNFVAPTEVVGRDIRE
jgi:hypothetical protein